MAKKTGRPPEDDLPVIRRMVELRASDQPLSVRAAAREAAKQLGLKGHPAGHLERLRKKFAALESEGELPVIESRVDRMRRYVRQAYADREVLKAQLRDQLAAREQEAAELGLDITAEDLAAVARTLEHEKEAIEQRLHGDGAFVFALALERKLSADQADAEILKLSERYEVVKKEVEILRAISHLRTVLAPIRRVPAQEDEGFG